MRPAVVLAALILSACGGESADDDDDTGLIRSNIGAVEIDDVDLGVVEVGMPSPPFTVTIYNDEATSVAVLLSTDSPELALSDNDCVLPPSQSCTVTVSLTASALGAVAHELRAAALDGSYVVAPVTAAGAHRLTVERTGNGTITSDPPGIDCGSLCTGLFVDPAVELQASSTPPTRLVAWGGACTGTAPCALTLAGPTTVSAQFETLTGVTISSAGMGAGVVTYREVDTTGGQLLFGSRFVQLAGGAQAVAFAQPIGNSVFAGWEGACTGTGDCAFTISANGSDTLTATFAPAPSEAPDLLRIGATLTDSPTAAAPTPNGIVVGGDSGGDGMWFTELRHDGGRGPSLGDWSAGRLVSLAHDAVSGDILALTSQNTSSDDQGDLSLRRYTATGTLRWSVEPPATIMASDAATAVRPTSLGVDAAGNAYFLGRDTHAFVASYTPAGVERWRRSVSDPYIYFTALAVRGNLVAVGGHLLVPPTPTQGAHSLGRVFAYDLDGTALWDRTENGLAYDVQFADIAIDSDGDVVVAGHALLASFHAAGDLWWSDHGVAPVSGQTFVRLALHPDDSIYRWYHNPTGNQVYQSYIRPYGENGVPMTLLGSYVLRAGDLVATSSGLYLAGRTTPFGYPFPPSGCCAVIERRP